MKIEGNQKELDAMETIKTFIPSESVAAFGIAAH